MKIKLCPEARHELQVLGDSKNVWIEGSVVKLLDDCDGEFSEYIKSAIENDTSKRKKRLEMTKQVQDQNKELQKKG